MIFFFFQKWRAFNGHRNVKINVDLISTNFKYFCVNINTDRTVPPQLLSFISLEVAEILSLDFGSSICMTQILKDRVHSTSN